MFRRGTLWPWSHGSWIYNLLCNQCLSPLMLWVLILLRARCTTLCHKVCQWLAAGQWFSLDTPVSSTNKTDCHDLTEILLKVAFNTITLTLTLYLRKMQCPWWDSIQRPLTFNVCHRSTNWAKGDLH